MKVFIGSAGRFHTFDLARQMERLGNLGRVYTAYPKWKVDGIPVHKVSSFPWLLVPQIVFGRAGFRSVQCGLNRVVIETFDRWMARNLESCDVFHCLSSFGVKSHSLARAKGTLTVCDRGSSHIVYQDRILRQEYLHRGIDFSGIDQWTIDRELAEYESCDLVIVPSTFAYNSFIEMGVSATKLRKISYGVDLSLFRPIVKADRVFRVIYVGVIGLRKGVPYLLDALRRLDLPRFEVWFIGSVLPEIQPFLQRCEGQFRYLGVIPRRELYKYYSQASVLVLPSLEEGLALVQAQGMACGLPVIATANTGAEDLFTDGVEGFIVPIRDPQSIRDKILYLYENPDKRDQMAAAALSGVRSLGGWDTYGDQMAECHRLNVDARSTSS
jgi:glycosyltransferase involved in cell wall biosynthesis